MPLFTPQTAAIMAHKRWSAEKLPATRTASCEQSAATSPAQTEASRTREHIESINQQLDNCTDPDEWDALTRSKERLFRIWARLSQIPMDPKASTIKQAQRSATVEPIGPAPVQSTPEPKPSSP